MPVGDAITSFPLLTHSYSAGSKNYVDQKTRLEAKLATFATVTSDSFECSNSRTVGVMRNTFRSIECFRRACCLHLQDSSTWYPSETFVRITVQAVSNYTQHRVLLYVVNTLHTSSYHRWCHTKLDTGDAKQEGASSKCAEIGFSRIHQMHHFHLGFAGSGPPHLL